MISFKRTTILRDLSGCLLGRGHQRTLMVAEGLERGQALKEDAPRAVPSVLSLSRDWNGLTMSPITVLKKRRNSAVSNIWAMLLLDEGGGKFFSLAKPFFLSRN